MPFTTMKIGPPVEYSDMGFFTNRKKENVLQSINVASIAGSLQQLGLLSEYAADIFENILQSTNEINERIINLKSRTNDLFVYLPDVDEILKSSQFRMSSGPTAQTNTEQFPQTSLITKESIPRSVLLQYSQPNVHRVIPVHDIDSLLTPEEFEQYGPCAKKYSYPQLFVEEWIRTQKEKERARKELRSLRRRERDTRRKQKVIHLHESVEKKKGINWRDRYAIDYTMTQRIAKASSPGTKQGSMEHAYQSQMAGINMDLETKLQVGTAEKPDSGAGTGDDVVLVEKHSVEDEEEEDEMIDGVLNVLRESVKSVPKTAVTGAATREEELSKQLEFHQDEGDDDDAVDDERKQVTIDDNDDDDDDLHEQTHNSFDSRVPVPVPVVEERERQLSVLSDASCEPVAMSSNPLLAHTSGQAKLSGEPPLPSPPSPSILAMSMLQKHPHTGLVIPNMRLKTPIDLNAIEKEITASSTRGTGVEPDVDAISILTTTTSHVAIATSPSLNIPSGESAARPKLAFLDSIRSEEPHLKPVDSESSSVAAMPSKMSLPSGLAEGRAKLQPPADQSDNASITSAVSGNIMPNKMSLLSGLAEGRAKLQPPADQSDNASITSAAPGNIMPNKMSLLSGLAEGRAKLQPPADQSDRLSVASAVSGNTARSSILDAIKQGTSLRPVVKRPKSIRRSSRISSGIGSVYGGAVHTLLERRRHLKDEESEDESEEDEDDWN